MSGSNTYILHGEASTSALAIDMSQIEPALRHGVTGVTESTKAAESTKDLQSTKDYEVTQATQSTKATKSTKDSQSTKDAESTTVGKTSYLPESTTTTKKITTTTDKQGTSIDPNVIIPVGVVVGGMVLVTFVVSVTCIVVRKRQRRPQPATQHASDIHFIDASSVRYIDTSTLRYLDVSTLRNANTSLLRIKDHADDNYLMSLSTVPRETSMLENSRVTSGIYHDIDDIISESTMTLFKMNTSDRFGTQNAYENIGISSQTGHSSRSQRIISIHPPDID